MGNRPSLALGQAEPCGRGSHGKVAAKQEFQASAEGMTLDGSDQRLRAAAKKAHEVVPDRGGVPMPVLLEGRHGAGGCPLEVASCAEGIVVAGQHHGKD